MMMAAKVLLGLGLVGGGIAAAVGVAHAAGKPTDAEALPLELRAKEQSALSSADPAIMREVADEIEKAGFPKQARTLRAAADAIEAAIKDVQPDPDAPAPPGPAPGPGPGPGPSPGVRPPSPVVKMGRVIHVHKNEGPFQVTQRVLGHGASLDRMRELEAANVPFDADGQSRIIDHHTGQLIEPASRHGIDEGDRLNAPDTWPASEHITTEQVGVPLVAVRGDGGASCSPEELRKLAGRIALEVASKDKGSENRDLIATFQNVERALGRRMGAGSGLYDAETAQCLAMVHGIAPPTVFGDGKELYYATNPAPEKSALRDCLHKLAQFDPRRAEEWLQSAAGVR